MICDNCCSTSVVLTTTLAIYGRKLGTWPVIYYCEDCKAIVGCHAGTHKPLGKMADRETRKLRIKAHSAFDKLWKSQLMSRSKAYDWLSLQLGINAEDCHISNMSKDQLKDVQTLSADYLANNEKVLARRKEKHDAKQQKRIERLAATERRLENEKRRKRSKR